MARSRKRRVAADRVRTPFDTLEDRIAPAVTVGAMPPAWSAAGDAASYGLAAGLADPRVNPVSGAVHVVAIHPNFNASPIAYVGTAGGVFKTADFRAAQPVWQSASSGLGSTAVLALAVDPSNPNLLYAGTAGGLFSSSNAGGSWTSVLATFPGSAATTPLGGRTSTVFIAGGFIYAATDTLGLVRRNLADAGTVWTPVSQDLPGLQSNWRIDDVLYLSGATPRLVAAVQVGGSVALFRATVGAGIAWDATAISTVPGSRGRLATRTAPGGGAIAGAPVYFAVAGNDTLQSLAVSYDQGGSVSSLSTPFSVENSGNAPLGVNSGDFPFALAVDPADGNVLYLGGRAQSANNAAGLPAGVGRIFKLTVNAGSVVDPQQQAVGSGSAPAGDTNYLGFIPNGGGNDLIEADRGGVYSRSSAGAWMAKVGTGLGVPALSGVAYDTATGSIFASTSGLGVWQQNGAAWSTAPTHLSGTTPTQTQNTGGSAVAYDGAATFNAAAISLRYSISSFSEAWRGAYDRTSGAQIDLVTADALAAQRMNFATAGGVALSGLNRFDRTAHAPVRFAMHATPSASPFPLGGGLASSNNRVLLAGEGIYQSFDGGATVTEIFDHGTTGAASRPLVTALAYAGTSATAIVYTARADGILRSGIAARGGWTWTPTPTTILGLGGPAEIVAIRTAPGDGRTAFALAKDGRIFRTTTAGVGTLGAPGWQLLASDLPAVMRGDASDLAWVNGAGANPARLVVAASTGVFSSVATTTLSFTRAGVFAANVPVRSLTYDATANKFVAGTDAGAFVLAGAREAIAAPSVLLIGGDETNDVVTLASSASVPGSVEVYDKGTLVGRYRGDDFQTIRFEGNGGSDALTLDVSRGAVRPQIVFAGGSGINTIGFTGQADAPPFLSLPPGAGIVQGAYTIAGQAGTFLGLDAQYTTSTPTTTPAVAPALIGGFASAIDALSRSLATSDGLSQSLPLFNDSLPAALAGGDARNLLMRFFTDGTSGQPLATLLNRISTLDGLRAALDGIDGVDGNVSFVETANSARFEIGLNRDLSGVARLGIGGQGGRIDLSGTVTVTARVRLNFAIGIDASGIYIEAGTEPLAVIDQLRMSNVNGAGRFGLTDVTFNSGTLAAEPTMGLSATLKEGAADAIAGTPLDAKLRLYELANPAGRWTGNVAGTTGVNAVDLMLNLVATAQNDGAALPVGFPASGSVRVFYANYYEPSGFTYSAANAADEDFVSLGRFTTFTLIDGLYDFFGWANAVTATADFDTPLPLASQGLAALLDGNATDYLLPQAKIAALGAPVTIDTFRQQTVWLDGTVDVASIGLNLGGEVKFDKIGGGTATGSIIERSRGKIIVQYDASAATGMASTPNLAFVRKAALPYLFRAALGDLADPIYRDNAAPTLQSFLPLLRSITGQAWTLETAGSGASRTISLTGKIDPAAVAVRVPLDLSSIIPGLVLTNPPMVDLNLDAKLDVKFGVRLDPALAATTADRFFAVPNATTPAVSVRVTANVDNPALAGTLGFLNVSLLEAGGANAGLNLDTTFNVFLADPNLIFNTAGIALDREFTDSEHTEESFTTAVNGSLDIDGLVLAPTVGTGNTLTPITLALDGTNSSTTAGGGGGAFNFFGGLKNLKDRIAVSGGSTLGQYVNFKNLTAGEVVDTLNAFATALSAIGNSGVLSSTIPIIGKSLSQAIDLGTIWADSLGAPAANNANGRDALALIAHLLPRVKPSTPVTSKVLPDAIEFTFVFEKDVVKNLPVVLDLDALGGLVSTNTSGLVQFAFTGTLNLTIGLRTAPDLAPEDRAYLNTSAVNEVTVSGTANSGYRTATNPSGLGDFTGGIQLGMIPFPTIKSGRILANPSVNADLGDLNADDRLYAREVANTPLGGGNLLTGTYGGLLQGTIPIRASGSSTVPTPNPSATAGTAWVSVLGKLENLSTFEIITSPSTALHNTGPLGATGGLDDPILATNPLVSPTKMQIAAYGVGALQDAESFNPDLLPAAFVSGVGSHFANMKTSVFDRVGVVDLPIIGNELREITSKYFTTVGNALASALGGMGPLVTDDMKAVIASTLGSDLGDWNGDNGNNPGNVNDITVIKQPDRVQFNFRIKHTENSPIDINANFGFPGLGLKLTDSTLNAFAQYDIVVRLGFSKKDGFYYDTSNASQPVGRAGTEEVILAAGIDLTSLNLTGSLGFLELKAVKDTTKPNGVAATFAIDFKTPRSDGRLLPSDITARAPKDILTATANLAANLNLKLELGFGNPGLPGLIADFYFNWNPVNANLLEPNKSRIGGAPALGFTGVGLDVGGAVNQLLQPILAKLGPVLDATKAATDVFNTRIPGLSNIADAFPAAADALQLDILGSNPAATVGDIAALALKFLVPGGDVINKVIDIVNTVASIVAKFKVLGSPGGQRLVMPLGDLVISSGTANRDIRSVNLSNLSLDQILNGGDLLVDFKDKLAGAVSSTLPVGNPLRQPVLDMLDTLESKIAGRTRKLVSFPLFDDPKTGLGLLIGKDVDLFRFQPPVLDMKLPFDVSAPVPIFPGFSIGLYAEVNVKIDLSAGFDTFGLRKFITTLANTGTLEPSVILEGFYITDVRNKDGSDAPEITIAPEFGIKAGLSYGIASIFAKGGLVGKFTFALNDCDEAPGDGKIRISGIPFNDPKSIADITVSLGMEISLELEIGISPFSISIDISILPPITFFEFENIHDCPTVAAPILAGLSGGALTLFVGDAASSRNVFQSETKEQYDLAIVDGMLEVRAFGLMQSFPLGSVTSINGNFGSNNDRLTVDPNLLISLNIQGGTGDDKLTGGLGNDTLEGDDGVDRIIASGGNDIVRGGAGNDDLQGEDGNDTIEGGTDNDSIVGGLGNDILRGDGGNDTASGDDGNDTLEGGAGADKLMGGLGNDTMDGGTENDSLRGGDGIDNLIGGPGADTLRGENGNDTLAGGTENDLLDGGAGDDVLTGDAGDDELLGGLGADTLLGHAGFDTLLGGSQSDILDGGSEDDRLYGEAGNDVMHGGTGADYLSGATGNDEMHGNDGADTLQGEEGADFITGDAGFDLISGGDGNDTIDGGTESDVIFGGDAEDTITGGTGNDRIDGGAGFDVITGNEGADTIEGGAGNDTISGNEENDSLSGGAGDDLIYGHTGNDTLDGGAGNDVLIGSVGGDVLRGGTGLDALYGDDPTTLYSVLETPQAPLEVEAGYTDFTTLVRPASLTDPTVNQGVMTAEIDTIDGGADRDIIFAGGGDDLVRGGAGNDYIDAGLGNDTVYGDAGQDQARGGAGQDVLNGDSGRDWLFGDGGDDLLFGDDGDAGNQDGQRLYGGSGIDTLRAYSVTTLSSEAALVGDSLYGGDGGDFLYGSLRREKLDGQAGNDFIHGEYLEGPTYATNTKASTTGGPDTLLGGFGQDQLFGGGGGDTMYGGEDSDWLEGQDGADVLRGGWGIDILLLDVDSRYTNIANDSFDGFGGNFAGDTQPDLLETDILLVQGNANQPVVGVNDGLNDVITIMETETTPTVAGKLNVQYRRLVGPDAKFEVNWRTTPGVGLPSKPLVEQIQVSGLTGNDTISVTLQQATLDALAKNNDWVTVLLGGTGNDTITGTGGPDRIEGGAGKDIMYGMAGDDRLWGDLGTGQGNFIDLDTFYGGTGDDDLIGGQGDNVFQPWSRAPQERTLAGVRHYGVFVDATGAVVDISTLPVGQPLPSGLRLEDTGLNRVLGNPNPEAYDYLYGGTGLDFLYGNNSASATVNHDTLYDKDGREFEVKQNTGVGGEPWKQYAKSTNKVWYVAGSGGNDTIDVDYVTNPYNPLFGRHVVTFRTAGSFDPRVAGFDTFGAFSNNSTERVRTQTLSDPLRDSSNVGADNVTGLIRDTSALFAALVTFGAASPTDYGGVIQALFGPAPAIQAIVVDGLAGNDIIRVNETTRASVWVDAGDGNDTVTFAPFLSFLPDNLDPITYTTPVGSLVPVRGNDVKATAALLGSGTTFDAPLAGSMSFSGLTIDSARGEQPDIDWYRFRLAGLPLASDSLSLRALHSIPNLNLSATFVNGVTETKFTNGLMSLAGLDQDTDYFVRVESALSIPVDYALDYFRTDTPDTILGNTTAAAGFDLKELSRHERITGLTVTGSPDWYRFRLAATADSATTITFSGLTAGASYTVLLGAGNGSEIASDVVAGTGTYTFNLAGLSANEYTLRVTSATAAAYKLGFTGGEATPSNNFTSATAHLLFNETTPLDRMAPVVQPSSSGLPPRYYSFNLSSTGLVGEAIRLAWQETPGLSYQDTSLTYTVELAIVEEGIPHALRNYEVSQDVSASVELAGLPAGSYELKVTQNFAGFVYDTLRFSSSLVPDLRSRLDYASVTVRDVGTPSPSRRDILMGGAGDDVLQGGNFSDWLFGGAGNDMLTGGLDGAIDDLIFGEDGDDRFQIQPNYVGPELTKNDYLHGGDGFDRVVYQGLDGLTGRDYVLLGYDRFLARYRVGSVAWNDAESRFVFADGLWNLRVSTFETTAVEGMLVDTRGGADIVHADGGYRINGQTWGLERGDIQGRAAIYGALEIRGGSGQDIVYGGSGGDTIYGGNDIDYIQGGDGNDRILGEGGNDKLAGQAFNANAGYQYYQLPPASLQTGTPDTGVPTVSGVVSVPAFELAAPEPARTWNYAGVSLPNSGTVSVADAFALEGREPNQQLQSLTPIGDFNGDGQIDYVVGGGGLIADNYMLFGPLTPDQLFRVDMSTAIDPSTAPADLRVRGNAWSYNVSVQNDDQNDPSNDAATFADQYRVTGLSNVRLLGTNGGTPFVPAKRMGDTNADGFADVVLVSQSGSNLAIRTMLGRATTDITTNINPSSTTVTNVNNVLGTPQAFVHKRDGGNVGDLLVVGTGSATGFSNGTVGYLFYNGTYQTGNQVVLQFNTKFQAGARFYAAVGDFNGDNRDDTLIGVENYAVGGVGRVYLIPGEVNSGKFTGVLAQALDTTSSFIWQGVGLGPVFALGDMNGDGRDEFAISRTVTAGGSVGGYLFSGDAKYKDTRPTQAGNIYIEDFGGTLGTFVRGSTGATYTGAYQFSSGDYDGDGQADVLVGLPQSTRSDSVPDTLANAAYVFRPVYGAFYGSKLESASVAIPGDAAASQFGTLGSSFIDLNGDRLSDILVAAPAATVATGYATGGSGRIYAIFGSQQTATIGATVEPIGNRSIAGLGDAVVEQSDGSPYSYDRVNDLASGDGSELFSTGAIAFTSAADADRFEPQSGTWASVGGEYRRTAPDATEALSLLRATVPLRNDFELQASVGLPSGELSGSSALVFDYTDALNYKYASVTIEPDGSGFSYLYHYALGDVIDGVRTPRAQATLLYSDTPVKPTVNVRSTGSTIAIQAQFGPVSPVTTLSYSWPASDLPTYYRDETPGVKSSRFGVESLGTVSAFSSFVLSEPSRWYRVSFLGDGRVGDQIRLRMSDGITSRPSLPTPYQNHGTTFVGSFAPGNPSPVSDLFVGNTAGATFLPSIPGFAIGGQLIGGITSNSYYSILTVDLQALYSLIDTPEVLAKTVESAQFALRFNAVTGSFPFEGTVRFEALDAEPVARADTALNDLSTSGPRAFVQDFAASAAPGTSVTDAGPFVVNLTQWVRDALSRGWRTLGFKVSAIDQTQFGFNAPAISFNFNTGSQGSTSHFSITTAPRVGVVGDLLDSRGRQLRLGKDILDLRDVPSGDYYLRVYDPRQGGIGYQPPAERRFRIEIEAPKLGDADGLVDRDTVRGGDGNNILSGGDAIDRLDGGDGINYLTAQPYETTPPYAYSFNSTLGTTTEDQNRGNGATSEDSVVFSDGITAAATSAVLDSSLSVLQSTNPLPMKYQIARKLGLLIGSIDINSGPIWELARPIYASDMTAITELVVDGVGIDPNGLQYCSNLEILTIKPSSLAAFEVGIRIGRPYDGNLGLKNLRYLDLKGTDLRRGTSQTQPGVVRNPLEYLRDVLSLRHLNLTSANIAGTLSGGGSFSEFALQNNQFNPWASSFARLASLQWLRMAGVKFTNNGTVLASNFPYLQPLTVPLPGLEYFVLNSVPQSQNNATQSPVNYTALATNAPALRQLELQDVPLVRTIDPLLGESVGDDARPVSGVTFMETGLWSDAGDAGVFQRDARVLAAANAGKATYTLSNLVAGRSYTLSATWVGRDTNTTAARFTLVGGPAAVSVNQKVDPIGLLFGDRPWQTVLTFTATAATATIELDNANPISGHLYADGLRLTRSVLPELRFVDLRGVTALDDSFFDYGRTALENKLAANPGSFGLWFTDDPNAPELAPAGAVRVFAGELAFYSPGRSDADGQATKYSSASVPVQYAGLVSVVANSINNSVQISTAANFSGTVPMTVTVSDGRRTRERTYLLEVAPREVVGETRVNTTTNSHQLHPRVAMAADGSYAAVWMSLDQAYGGSGYDIIARRFDRYGVPLTAEIFVNAVPNAHQFEPAIDCDAAGNFIVVWEDYFNGHLYGQKFAADGTRFQANDFLIDPAFSYQTNRGPAVVLNDDGTFAVAHHYQASNYDIYFQRFNVDGTFNGSYVIVTTNGNEQSFPQMVKLPGGNILLSYTNFQQFPDTSGYGVWARIWNATTLSFGPEFIINSTTTDHQIYARLAADSSGRFVAAWQSLNQDGSGYGIYAQRHNADGSRFGGEFLVNTYTASDQNAASVTLDDAGNVTVAWASTGQDGSSGGIFARRFRFDDVAANPALGQSEFRVTQVTADDQSYVWLSGNAAGDTVAVWNSNLQDGSGYAVYSRRFPHDGTPQASAPAQVNITSVSNPASSENTPAMASASDGTSVVAWTSTVSGSNQVFARRFNADGTAASGEVLIGSGSAAAVAHTTAGSVVAFIVSATVFLRRLDATGAPVGAAFAVSTTTNANYFTPRVAMTESGQGMIVWSALFGGAFGRRFDGTGPLDAAQLTFAVSGATGANAPAVAVDAAGNFLVAINANSGGFRNYYRRYDAAGTQITPDTLVSSATFTAGSPAVAVTAAGEAVIAWRQSEAVFNVVRYRRLDATGELASPILFGSQSAASPGGNVAAAIDANGLITLGWERAVAPGSSPLGIYIRQFEADTPLGVEALLSSSVGDTSATVSLATLKNGDVSAVWQTFFTSPSQTDILSSRLSGNAALSSFVFDADYNPIVGAMVYQDRNGNNAFDASTDIATVTAADGSFTLTGLHAGTHNYVVDGLPGSIPSQTSYLQQLRNGEYLNGSYFFANRAASLGGDRSAVEGDLVLFTPALATGVVPTSYLWTVSGPGFNPPTASTPTFSFTVPDNNAYTVTLSVLVGTDLFTDTATVYGLNRLPTVAIAPTFTVNEGTPLTLAPTIVDVPADVLTYRWEEFLANTWTAIPGQTGPTYTPSTANNGPARTLRLRVNDDDQNTTFITASTVLTVNNVAPNNLAVVVQSGGGEGVPLTLHGSAVEPSPVDAASLLMAWKVFNPLNALIAEGGGTLLSDFIFTPVDQGTYRAEFTVTDADGGTAMLNQNFAVTNSAPAIASFSGPSDLDEEVSGTYAVSFTDAGTLDTHTVRFTVRDVLNVVVADSGVITATTWNWTPSFSGYYTVRVTVTDNATASVTPADRAVTVHNVRPRQLVITTPDGTLSDGGGALTLVGSYRDPVLVEETVEIAWSVTNAAGNVVASGTGASYDFTPRANGTFTATMTATNTRTGQSSTAHVLLTAINVPPESLPDVASVTINNGAAQRSRLTTIAVNFDRLMNTTLLANAFTLTRSDGAMVGTVNVATSTVGMGTVATLTFAGANTQSGSLADGVWTLTVIAVYAQSLAGTPLAADHVTGSIKRLFGDSNGDGTVDGATDFAAFGGTFGVSASAAAFNAAFDFNNDGTIDGSTDFAEFGARFGRTI